MKGRLALVLGLAWWTCGAGLAQGPALQVSTSASEAPAAVEAGALITEEDIIKGLAAYRTDWLNNAGEGFAECPERIAESFIDSVFYRRTAGERLVEGFTGADNKEYLGMIQEVVLGWRTPVQAWEQFEKKAPAGAALVDSAATVACFAALPAGMNIISWDILEPKAPFRLSAGGRSLLAEVLGYRLHAGDRVADIGAGSGGLSALLVYTGLEVTATEVPWLLDHLEGAREAMSPEVRPWMIPVAAGKKSTELPRGYYDAIIIRNAYHHFKRPKPHMADARGALRPGGRLLIADYYADRIPEDFDDECSKRQAFSKHLAVLRRAGFELQRKEDLGEGLWLTEWTAAGAE